MKPEPCQLWITSFSSLTRPFATVGTSKLILFETSGFNVLSQNRLFMVQARQDCVLILISTLNFVFV
jgi:hypothetical protein